MKNLNANDEKIKEWLSSLLFTIPTEMDENNSGGEDKMDLMLNKVFEIGEYVDVEWISGEFWRNGKLVDINGTKATVRLSSGWHVYPNISCLRKKEKNR